MADRGAGGVGSRIKVARRARGFRTAQELADAAGADNVTVATIENLEAGRRADVSVSQLLNIAMALRIPPVLLLAAVDSDGGIEVSNLSSNFDDMDARAFDAWFSATSGGAFRETSESGRADRAKLNAVREFEDLLRERSRLQVIKPLANDSMPVESRIAHLEQQIAELRAYLIDVGWAASESDR